MIVVFCDLGGSRILGKAREIADSSGDKVVGLSSEKSEDAKQNLIFLGADEVLCCDLFTVDWVPIISQIVDTEPNVRMIMFSSNPNANVVMGMVYSQSKAKTGSFLDGAESIDESGISKQIGNLPTVLQKRSSEDKTTLVSLKLSSFAEPFADTSRYGKIRSLDERSSGKDIPSLQNSSSKLIVLVGKECSEKTKNSAQNLTKRFRGEMKDYSGRIEVIYGPCIAIEISSRLKELPEFRGDLFSISSKKFPIGSIADLSIVTEEINSILERLAAS